ncbi:histone acetyltransferase catalytic subunit HAT1 NDAI_0B02180 [Naumovozyma dairenensis CBS 421]|uniref:Histone acetyltransferase type B catalytic subunit n=1 Tax=Naumovozyma dairenensis (strain ATCC 10597 / BCRC 20456 / CBS 421 / NBRC 0211 / NRRL Y-12639) TaxID=1071378 RepID=G0W642_NAUDC|nr:hypothetical protein NDAI_0B02180 [Naumovozyma dairenensis CBS 421]CCD23253.1 hypothetical protein NDAI_0B02180 [Naumovozyma dairenensis CBS 421]
MELTDFKPSTWISSSKDSLKISLVSKDGAVQFAPIFTYPIFGDAEQIVGYQDLLVHLAFDSITFRPFLNVKYSTKLDTEDIDDVEGELLKVLPSDKDEVILKDEAKWVDMFEFEQKNSFKLPEDKYKVNEYEIDKEHFVVYKMKLSDDEKFLKLHRRIQIFSLFFIEAASYIDEEDFNWDIYWLFNKEKKQCMGYATAYMYWKYLGGKDFDESKEPKHYRAKVSQFLILPPYQGKGHGSKLYQAIFKNWLSNDLVREFTVEDPSENFDDLRDRNDLNFLYENGFFQELSSKIVNEKDFISNEWLLSKQRAYKIEKRQFGRLVEMIMYKENLVNAFRHQVKRRLYLKNYDTLSEMTEAERKDALQKSYLTIKEDYERITCSSKFKKRHAEEIEGLDSKKPKPEGA